MLRCHNYSCFLHNLLTVTLCELYLYGSEVFLCGMHLRQCKETLQLKRLSLYSLGDREGHYSTETRTNDGNFVRKLHSFSQKQSNLCNFEIYYDICFKLLGPCCLNLCFIKKEKQKKSLHTKYTNIQNLKSEKQIPH